MPSFRTANNEKRLLTCYDQSTRPTHFMKKPPISVFANGSENQPPIKKRKVEEANTQGTKQTSEALSTTSATNNNPSNKYEDCVFQYYQQFLLFGYRLSKQGKKIPNEKALQTGILLTIFIIQIMMIKTAKEKEYAMSNLCDE